MYYDYPYGFGMVFYKNYIISNMRKEIKRLLRKNRIRLDGEAFALFLGGLLLAILLLISNPMSKKGVAIQDSSPSIVLDTNQVKNKQEDINDKDEKLKETEVTIYRNNGTIIHLPLEEYLIGVVGAEMPASFPIEALKAQAVVARTYALKKIQEAKKLTDTVSTQSYKDNNELKSLWASSYETYYQKVKMAVEATKGLVLYYQEGLIDAVYHSTSNGKTEDSVYVWGSEIPYLKSVDSSWDKTSSSYFKQISKDFFVVLQLLGVKEEGANIEVLSKDISGRVLKVKVGSKTFSGVEFRSLLGLRSTDFDLSIENNKLVITTRGYGHGVGMSQYGASGMAKEGYQYDEILKHYYTGISIHES